MGGRLLRRRLERPTWRNSTMHVHACSCTRAINATQAGKKDSPLGFWHTLEGLGGGSADVAPALLCIPSGPSSKPAASSHLLQVADCNRLRVRQLQQPWAHGLIPSHLARVHVQPVAQPDRVFTHDRHTAVRCTPDLCVSVHACNKGGHAVNQRAAEFLRLHPRWTCR